MLDKVKRNSTKNKCIYFMLDVFTALFVFASALFVSYIIKIFI